MGNGEPDLNRDAREILLSHAQLAIPTPRPRATEPALPAGAANQSLADWERQIVSDALRTARATSRARPLC